MDDHVQLFLPTAPLNEYLPALSIPVDAFPLYSLHPLKWLRFLGYTIYGTEGYLSELPGGGAVADYDANISSAQDYYYVSPEESPSRFLDPKLMDHNTSSTDVSSNRGNFRKRVKERDEVCLLTGSHETAQACYIVPHAKGDQYMINLVDIRGVVLDPPLDSILDTRNGIFLSSIMHNAFGTGRVALLQTPNFAMSPSDVSRSLQPNHSIILADNPPPEKSRLTLHNFRSTDMAILALAPHNCDAKQTRSKAWPPAFLFDVSYGCAALSTWGVQNFIRFVENHANNSYYDLDEGEDASEGGDDGEDLADGNGDGGNLGRAGTAGASDHDEHQVGGNVRRNNMIRPRERPANSHAKPTKNAEESQATRIAHVVMGFWVSNARKDMHRAHKVELQKKQEAVQRWRCSVDAEALAISVV